jgi:hypothetical protein
MSSAIWHVRFTVSQFVSEVVAKRLYGFGEWINPEGPDGTWPEGTWADWLSIPVFVAGFCIGRFSEIIAPPDVRADISAERARLDLEEDAA